MGRPHAPSLPGAHGACEGCGPRLLKSLQGLGWGTGQGRCWQSWVAGPPLLTGPSQPPGGWDRGHRGASCPAEQHPSPHRQWGQRRVVVGEGAGGRSRGPRGCERRRSDMEPARMALSHAGDREAPSWYPQAALGTETWFGGSSFPSRRKPFLKGKVKPQRKEAGDSGRFQSTSFWQGVGAGDSFGASGTPP